MAWIVDKQSACLLDIERRKILSVQKIDWNRVCVGRDSLIFCREYILVFGLGV